MRISEKLAKRRFKVLTEEDHLQFLGQKTQFLATFYRRNSGKPLKGSEEYGILPKMAGFRIAKMAYKLYLLMDGRGKLGL